MCLLMSFWLGKSRQQIAILINFGRQIEKKRFVLEGLAGEAVCWGRERVGVMLTGSIQLGFSMPHREGRRIKATASAADPQGKEVACEYWHFVKCSNEDCSL